VSWLRNYTASGIILSIRIARKSRGIGRLILTVTLNAAVDKTYRVEGFALDRVHRASDWRIEAGGKGINVARVFGRLGGQAVATGFLGGYNGKYIARALKAEGIESDFVQTREESRVCIAVVDPLSGTQTEINEEGPTISGDERAAFRRKFKSLVESRRVDCAVLSGSVPRGIPATIYEDLIEVSRKAGVPCALDASGEPLREGLKARPWIVKPNIHELSSIIGRDLIASKDIIAAAQSFRGTGVEYVLVTCGGKGAYSVSAEGVFKSDSPKIQFVSAVGSGDAFLGAFVWSLIKGDDANERLRIATGAGAANAAVYGSGFITSGEVERLSKLSRIDAID
jgi:tagatose 6-phosphate kinase